MAKTSIPFDIQRHSTSLPNAITDGTLHFTKDGKQYLDWGDERVEITGVLYWLDDSDAVSEDAVTTENGDILTDENGEELLFD